MMGANNAKGFGRFLLIIHKRLEIVGCALLINQSQRDFEKEI